MKFRITTTYYNVDREWMNWYMKRLAKEDVLPGSTGTVAKLKETGRANFISKDPSSNVTAETVYEVEGPLDGQLIAPPKGSCK